ncbi:ABC transporter substrate-binding protein [Evansella clarkii]|uniref:ABC transporter substrate-binding protein n=1 Tax=Evansella clarkii TaxID=79879 RepID=UPI000B4377EE|nr:ABC transporter substrate-binding protein [Evansella clarkii]
MGKQITKRFGLLSIILFFTAVLLAGCGANDQSGAVNGEDGGNAAETELNGNEEAGENGNNNNDPDNSANDGAVDGEGPFPVTIIDDAGKEITIEEEPESIISIQASNTEISYALGLGEKMIGVSDFCNYPEEALSVEKVGGQDMNAELILSLLPDIVLVTTYHHENHEEILKQYEEAGMDVIVIGDKSSFDEVYESIELVGKATGTSEEAEAVIADMQERHNTLKEKAEEITDKKKVWVEVSPAPDIFTTGQGTFMHEMLESINAENAAADQEGWVMLTEEEIVTLNPDVIITTYHTEDLQAEVASRDGWAEVPAVKNEEIFDVDTDTVVRPGPRLIEGVEELAKLIYPEVFGE